MNTKSTSELNQDIDFLNQCFGNDRISFFQVAPNLIKAVLFFSKLACAEVHLQGAHLTKWLDTLGRDNIFNSPTAEYKLGVPIRGGNPIIFPQFGPGKICQHGFARNSIWRVVAAKTTADATQLTLELNPNDVQESYRQQWPYDFVLTLTISLGESLISQLKVHNPNPDPLSFTLGFHTYLAVDDIHNTEIHGFFGLDYMDNLREKATFQENREIVTLSAFTDRRYQGIPTTLAINSKSGTRSLLMQTKNCQDAFVWNPWADAEKKLSDLAENSYKKFVCVEPGNMKTAVILPAGQDFRLEQEIKRL
jgi:glucose-6-phosphate 1-epimerase